MLLADVVATMSTVAGTRSRLAKYDAIAGLLRRAEAGEVEVVVGLLTGRLRQGRIGIGWAGLSRHGDRPADPTEPADAPAQQPPTAAPDGPPLTVLEVDAAIDDIAAASGPGSAGARDRRLAALFARATADERAALGGILLGEVRTGALEGVVLEGIARAAEVPTDLVRRAAMLSGDLRGTARLALTGGAADLDAVGLRVMTPVSPMLASTGASAAEALAVTGPASVEHKLDGARIQVHRDGDRVLIVTRSLADVTHRLPELVEIVRALPVQRVILDGETLALDEAGAPRPFQETMSRFGTGSAPDGAAPDGSLPGGSARAIQLRPAFFDVLHLDGVDLIDRPLAERLEVLTTIAGPWRIAGEVTADTAVAERVSREALAAGHEGIVVKALDSTYAAGRRGKSWVKVKPVRTVELVVLAVEPGSGRRTGWLSNLHLGARDPNGAFGEPGGFVMVGKTFKGLTDQTLRWQTEHFRGIEVATSPHLVRVRPETVVEIALDGVQRSSRYPGGVALRFARVKGYRTDKTPEQADTIDLLREWLGSPTGSGQDG